MDFSWGTKEMDKNLIYVVTDDVNPSEDKDPQGKEMICLSVMCFIKLRCFLVMCETVIKPKIVMV